MFFLFVPDRCDERYAVPVELQQLHAWRDGARAEAVFLILSGSLKRYCLLWLTALSSQALARVGMGAQSADTDRPASLV